VNELKNFPYKNVLVLGLAKSGMAAATFLMKNNKRVIVNDLGASEEDKDVQELRAKGAQVVLGSHPLSLLNNIDIIVKNPGIPYENVLIKEAIKQDIPIITEIELASLLIGNRMIGITGSNGKTTTTTLIYDMFMQAHKKVKLAGNIGTVATEVASQMTNDEQMIVELSSFQLLGTRTFKPKVAILLNIYEAHLDYHGTMENYIEAKFNMLNNQDDNDIVIFNKDNSHIREHIAQATSQKIPFSIKEKNIDGGWVNDDAVFYKDEKVIERKDIRLVGDHNLENILAAICCAKVNDISNEVIKRVLMTFSGVEHRLQFVEEINERLFYNDSKATNILATKKALAAFNQPTILLAGGLDRGNDFKEIIPALKHVKAMVLFGETKEKLKAAGDEANIEHIIFAENVKEATIKAFEQSAKGDVILLSPACASWDQYRTFEERGNEFIQTLKTIHK